MAYPLPHGLPEPQYRFLRGLLAPDVVGLEDAARRADIAPFVLRRWLAQPPFRRQLRLILDAVARRRDATLALAASRAAEKLAASLVSDASLSPTQHRVYVDLLRLARASTRRRACQNEAFSPFPNSAPSDLKPLLERLGEGEGCQ